MKRLLTSLTILLIIFVIFALVVGQLRDKSIDLRVPFLPTIHTSAEALAYVSYLVGFAPAALLALAGMTSVRRRYRGILAEQRKAAESSAHVGAPASESTADNTGQNPSS